VLNLGEGAGQPVRLRAFSPYGEGVACFGDASQPGRLVSSRKVEGGALLEAELPRLQPFGVLYDATPIAAGADLTKLPFITGSTAGGLFREGSIYGSGTVGAAQVEGRTWSVVSGHPPDNGRTALDWCLQLPPEPLRLRFHAELIPGGNPVAFEVQVNGLPVWGLPMPYPNGWKEGAVSLRPWAGQTVLLSLVTDSVGSNNCDWARWGDVRVEAE
jgi:hypothetical protein